MSQGLKPTNYIFALDESGSMSGDRWDTLIRAMKDNIALISSYNRLENQYISIFKFSSSVTRQF